MHDWTLLALSFDWKQGCVKVDVLNQNSNIVSVLAEEVLDLHIPKLQSWGPSASINNVIGPQEVGEGKNKLQIEMQSGDVIEIVATNFVMPPAA